jgi:hypothetical protein
MFRFVVASVALSSRFLEGDDDHHDHAHSASEEEMLKLPLCGCLAEEKGFKIDCSDGAAVKTAYDFVKACDDCSDAECLKNWAIVEAHHDLCLHDEIAEEIEKGFHDLEEAPYNCPHTCLVGRKTGGLADCAPAQCDKAKALTDAMTLEDCMVTCTEKCGADYAILRALHDTCEDGTLTMAMEKVLHDVEESCESYNCWAESSHCDGVKGENSILDLPNLKERAFDKCKFTEADAKLCPAAPAAEDDASAAYAAVFLAYFLA